MMSDDALLYCWCLMQEGLNVWHDSDIKPVSFIRCEQCFDWTTRGQTNSNTTRAVYLRYTSPSQETWIHTHTHSQIERHPQFRRQIWWIVSAVIFSLYPPCFKSCLLSGCYLWGCCIVTEEFKVLNWHFKNDVKEFKQAICQFLVGPKLIKGCFMELLL